MVEKRLAGAYARGCLRGAAIRLIVSIAVIGLFGLCVVGAFLIETFSPSSSRGTGLIIMLTLFVLVIFGGTGIGGFLWWRRNNAKLDAYFEPFGLKGSRYTISGRQFAGVIDGRRVYVRYLRPGLTIHVQSEAGTRMGIGLESALGEALGSSVAPKMKRIDPGGDLESLAASALDESWGRALLDNESARAALGRLLIYEGAQIRSVTVSPQAVTLTTRYITTDFLEADSLRGVLDALVALAEAAEDLPSPMDRVEPAAFDHTWDLAADPYDAAATSTGARSNKVVWITAAVIGTMLLCFVVIGVGAFAFAMLMD